MTRSQRTAAATAVTLVVALVVAYIALSVWSRYSVHTDFYRLLGMGDVFATRWQTSILLWLVGAAAAPLVAAPLWALGLAGRPRGRRPPPAGPHPGHDASDAELDAWTARRETLLEWELASRRGGKSRAAGVVSRRVFLLGWLAFVLLLAVELGGSLAGDRDGILAALNAVSFGVSDPIFGRDVAFHVFTVPALSAVLGSLVAALLLTLVVAGVAGVAAVRAAAVAGDNLRARAIAARATTVGFVYVGLLLVCSAGLVWLARYRLLSVGEETIAGPGAAVRSIDIPSRTVAALVLAALGVAMLVLAVPRIRERAEPSTRRAVTVIAGGWVAIALLLAVVATPWWVLLAVPALLFAFVTLRAAEADAELASLPVPIWTWPAAAVITAIVVTVLGPIGARLYDAVLLRGTRLQVERPYIESTLEMTRRATGLDRARTEDAEYRPNGVTQTAINRAPASVNSLRFLDQEPTERACARQQLANSPFYSCDDVDVDRYSFDGVRRTVFVVGREIDYSRAPDFQRRHFTYTHGYGVVMAPVNEVDSSGGPRWLAGGIPQTGIDPPLRHTEIYFGAQTDMPWAMVNTRQPVFDRDAKLVAKEWDGGTGIDVGSGLRRLAVTRYLGGLPYVGGGRQVWNATDGDPAGAGSRLLLFRDIQSRARELAPFLRFDHDPYFVAAGGRLHVLLNAYAGTTRYPYGARFATPGQPDGPNYLRNAGVLVMDAYSGETRLYAADDAEPITATWRRVYPDLFTSMDQMPAALRPHLRYGEDLFEFQSKALERFHVSDVDTFYNEDQTWAPTEEFFGHGAQGEKITSLARYTYAVLPGESEERFLLMRSYKPLARGKGIGFSGWFAVDNEPDRFGQATILRFPTTAEQPLDSLDTFSSNVGRDPELSAEIGVRRDQVRRGNTIVVPIGQGLLYAQPLYLDTREDPLPRLWRVVVSFGDNRVHAAPSYREAVQLALSAAVGGDAPGEGGTPPTQRSLDELVEQAAREFEAYRKATGAGKFEEASQHLERLERALDEARRRRGQGEPEAPAPSSPARATPGAAGAGRPS